jgi:hypothetical protein
MRNSDHHWSCELESFPASCCCWQPMTLATTISDDNVPDKVTVAP